MGETTSRSHKRRDAKTFENITIARPKLKRTFRLVVFLPSEVNNGAKIIEVESDAIEACSQV